MAMANLWLSAVLVAVFPGPAAALLLTVPEPVIFVSAGNTALLPASLNLSTSVPDYFQVRWHFVTGSQLVLILKADNCMGQNGTQHWRDLCEISTEKTVGYRHRAALSSKDVTLVLQDMEVEDSGIYRITLLALGVKLSACINLTVTNVEVDIPVFSVMEASGRDYTMSNAIRLSFAGLILCLLVLIISEHISFGSCKEKRTRVRDEQKANLYEAVEDVTSPPVQGKIYLLTKTPNSEDLEGLYCFMSY
ncbi:Hyaluronan and proteoglycan link protein 2 [Varanus komodoensis]|nr:Hyaluronan and proteoglycan link protein 2 [Varanus komodoensis]